MCIRDSCKPDIRMTAGRASILISAVSPPINCVSSSCTISVSYTHLAGQLPKEQDALTKRMQMLRPVLLNNSTTFEVVVDNEFAAKDLDVYKRQSEIFETFIGYLFPVGRI